MIGHGHATALVGALVLLVVLLMAVTAPEGHPIPRVLEVDYGHTTTRTVPKAAG